MSEIKYNIIKHLAVLSTSPKNWTKEVNVVSWNDVEPVIDVRNWNEDKTKMSKGITMTIEEFEKLKGVNVV